MSRDLDPSKVAHRLAGLRAGYVAEDVDEGRRRLALERPSGDESFAQGAARRLAELRALCELADHLHRGPSRGTG
jgi:hypothetical protein